MEGKWLANLRNLKISNGPLLTFLEDIQKGITPAGVPRQPARLPSFPFKERHSFIFSYPEKLQSRFQKSQNYQ